MNELCLAKKKCKSMGSALCETSCSLFMDIQYQIQLSSIPKKHRHYLINDLPSTFYATDVFKRFCSSISERVGRGEGLYLYSSLTGTGKSTTACTIAMEFIIEQLKSDFCAGRRTPQLAKFINVPDFLDDLRKGMNDNDAAVKAIDLMSVLKRVPVVIMDDFGAEKMSEWARERLLTIISERYDNERSIIFTANLTLKEVEVLHGTRIRSRIEGMTVPIEFKGSTDWRRKI